MNSTSRLSASAFTLFSVLWAAATLFHMASYDQWGHSRYLALAAGWVLLRPGSLLAVAVLGVLEIDKAIALSPFVPNHWLFTTFVNITILLAMLLVLMRRGRLDSASLFESFAPAVRVAVLLLYAFVVFHKLNADFFDPELSCGTMFYAAHLERLPFLPQGKATEMVSIYAAIGAEAAIPLLLAFRRTRVAGILVGSLFHVFLSINPIDRFYNFSSMLLAVFSLFAPATVVEKLQPEGRRFKWFARVVLAGIVAALTIQRWLPASTIAHIDPFFVLWNVYAAVVIVSFVAALLATRSAPVLADPGSVFAIREPLLLVLPLLVFVNGITPYAGLKTETAWAMFSNLRTEGGKTNHFLVPAGWQAFDFQRDVVRVTASSDRMLDLIARKGQLVPYFELRRRPNASVTYVRDGVEYSFARISDDPAFSGTIPPALRRLLLFRGIDPSDEQPCVH